MVVAHRTTSLSNVLHTRLVGTLDVVAKGEERITAQTYIGVLGKPGFLFFHRQRFRLLGEELLPGAFTQYIFIFVANIDIDGVVAVSTTNTFLKRQSHHLRTLTQPPDVGLVACQTSAVDAALLPCTNADGLTVLHIADRIGLGVFQCDKRNLQVAFGFRRKVLVLGWNVLEKVVARKVYLVSALLKGNAKDLLTLNGSRLVGRVYLDDIVSALALFTQDAECLLGIARSNDAVADFTLDEQCGSLVASVTQGNEIAVAGHTVSSTCPSVCCGNG